MVPIVQAAKTYLERKFEEFPSCDVDALLQHGLKVSISRPICVIHLWCLINRIWTFLRWSSLYSFVDSSFKSYDC